MNLIVKKAKPKDAMFSIRINSEALAFFRSRRIELNETIRQFLYAQIEELKKQEGETNGTRREPKFKGRNARQNVL